MWDFNPSWVYTCIHSCALATLYQLGPAARQNIWGLPSMAQTVLKVVDSGLFWCVYPNGGYPDWFKLGERPDVHRRWGDWRSMGQELDDNQALISHSHPRCVSRLS